MLSEWRSNRDWEPPADLAASSLFVPVARCPTPFRLAAPYGGTAVTDPRCLPDPLQHGYSLAYRTHASPGISTVPGLCRHHSGRALYNTRVSLLCPASTAPPCVRITAVRTVAGSMIVISVRACSRTLPDASGACFAPDAYTPFTWPLQGSTPPVNDTLDCYFSARATPGGNCDFEETGSNADFPRVNASVALVQFSGIDQEKFTFRVG